MDLPSNYTLPFFSYGLFQPGQIGFHSLRPYLQSHESGWRVEGELLQRDGLPILLEADDTVPGTLLRFKAGHEAHAYLVIAKLEPDKLYRWEQWDAHKGSDQAKVNVLAGLKGDRGVGPLDTRTWDGRREPLFRSALDVVDETLQQNHEYDEELKALFRLQMAYMLLWSAIERYASFRYHLGDRVTEKVNGLAQNTAFQTALRDIVSEKRVIYRCDDPEKKEILDPTNARKSIAYYFQVRSNITHRGKAYQSDHEMLVKSLKELLAIFRRVLDAEFSLD
jgi:hypothetical protein